MRILLPLTLAFGLAASSPAFAKSGHGEHIYFTDDADGDGTANWMDSDSEAYVLGKVGFHAMNFFILFGVLGYFARKPLGDALRSRALGIRTELVESAKARDEAAEAHQEIEARLGKIEDEITALLATAKAEATAEEAKLMERAQRESERIAESAQRSIQDETTRAKLALRREAVELAVQLAEGVITKSISHDDQQSLARDFLQSLNQGAADA